MKNKSIFRCFKRGVALALWLACAAPAAAQDVRIMVFGDSLVAGHGLALREAFPARLEERLRAAGYAAAVVNAGVGGETTSGARTRLAWTLQQAPDYAILVTGANDMLRAVDPAVTRENLDFILRAFAEKGVPVLLAGMKSFRNLGSAYNAVYDALYADLAAAHGAVYYPFFLDGVALEPAYNQDDVLHPNAAGVDRIVTRIFPYVEELIGKGRG